MTSNCIRWWGSSSGVWGIWCTPSLSFSFYFCIILILFLIGFKVLYLYKLQTIWSDFWKSIDRMPGMSQPLSPGKFLFLFYLFSLLFLSIVGIRQYLNFGQILAAVLVNCYHSHHNKTCSLLDLNSVSPVPEIQWPHNPLGIVTYLNCVYCYNASGKVSNNILPLAKIMELAHFKDSHSVFSFLFFKGD